MNQQPVPSPLRATLFCTYCKRQTKHDVHFNLKEDKYLICINCKSAKKAA